MDAQQLQFIFSLFSFVGVIGILFYLIIDKAKSDEHIEKIERLEREVTSLKDYVFKCEERLESSQEPKKDAVKEKIIELYKEGKDLIVIENSLNVPRAKIEMVLKFYKLQNGDNWKPSVD